MAWVNTGNIKGPKGDTASVPSDGPAATPSLRSLGTGATQAAAGNDARLSDTRTPTDLSVTAAKVAAANKDGTAATPSMRTLGTGAQQAAAGNDARLSDTRTPTDLSVTAAKVAAANKDGSTFTPSMRTLGTGAQQAAAGDDPRIVNAVRTDVVTPYMRMQATAATPQVIASGGSPKVVLLNSITTGDAAWPTMGDTTNGRIYAPWSGWYHIAGNCAYATSNTTGYRAVVLYVVSGGISNIVASDYRAPFTGFNNISTSGYYWITAGDYVDMRAIHTAGIDVNLQYNNSQPWLAVTWCSA